MLGNGVLFRWRRNINAYIELQCSWKSVVRVKKKKNTNKLTFKPAE